MRLRLIAVPFFIWEIGELPLLGTPLFSPEPMAVYGIRRGTAVPHLAGRVALPSLPFHTS
jgi:hypothetical protein